MLIILPTILAMVGNRVWFLGGHEGLLLLRWFVINDGPHIVLLFLNGDIQMRRGVEMIIMSIAAFNQVSGINQGFFRSPISAVRNAESPLNRYGAEPQVETVHIAAQVKIKPECTAIECGVCLHPIAFVDLKEIVLTLVFMDGNEHLIRETGHNSLCSFFFFLIDK